MSKRILATRDLFSTVMPEEAPQPKPRVHRTKAEMVLDCIDSFGQGGCTCEEVVRKLRMRHQTVSARIIDLREVKEILPLSIDGVEVTRKTSSGRRARVWVAKRYKAKRGAVA